MNLFPTIGHADKDQVFRTSNPRVSPGGSNTMIPSPRYQDEADTYDPTYGHKKYFLKEYANNKIGTNVMLKVY